MHLTQKYFLLRKFLRNTREIEISDKVFRKSINKYDKSFTLAIIINFEWRQMISQVSFEQHFLSVTFFLNALVHKL